MIQRLLPLLVFVGVNTAALLFASGLVLLNMPEHAPPTLSNMLHPLGYGCIAMAVGFAISVLVTAIIIHDRPLS